MAPTVRPAFTFGRLALAMLCAAALAACAPRTEADNSNAVQTGPSTPNAGSTLLSIIGTPFYLAFKIPVCAVTLAVSAPTAGASELTGDFADGQDLRRDLGEGVADNCGPPYAVTP